MDTEKSFKLDTIVTDRVKKVGIKRCRELIYWTKCLHVDQFFINRHKV